MKQTLFSLLVLLCLPSAADDPRTLPRVYAQAILLPSLHRLERLLEEPFDDALPPAEIHPPDDDDGQPSGKPVAPPAPKEDEHDHSDDDDESIT